MSRSLPLAQGSAAPPTMGWGNQERELAALSLRRAAKRCGLPKEGPSGWGQLTKRSPQASLKVVADWCAASSGPTAAKAAAAAAWAEYEATFPLAPATGPRARSGARRPKAAPVSPRRRLLAAHAAARGGARAKSRAKEKAKAKVKVKAKAKGRAPPPEEEEEGEGEGGEEEGGEEGANDRGDAEAQGAAEGNQDEGANEEGAGEGVDDAVPAAGGGGGGRKEFRVRGTSFLFTYNHLWLSERLPDGGPPFASVDELWEKWQAWQAERVSALGIKHFTSTIEESLQSEDAGRVHVHLKVNLKEATYIVRCISISYGSLNFYGQ